MNWFERTIALFAPKWAESRALARHRGGLLARHYEAATVGNRSKFWARNNGDADASSRAALLELRIHARDLARNNAWAVSGIEVITSNVVGDGIVASSKDTKALELWNKWAGSTACDQQQRLNFSALQEQILRSLITDGEVLVRRRRRRIEDELPIPVCLEVLEIDYLDSSHDAMPLGGLSGGFVKQGIEYDALGRVSGYYLFEEHPGSAVRRNTSISSVRVAETEILHIFRTTRPGQSRGVSWLAPIILTLKDFDRYEDAQLLKQQISASFAAFVTNIDGQTSSIGQLPGPDGQLIDPRLPELEAIAPGGILYTRPGEDVKFPSPPSTTADGFDIRNLRRVAAGLGITYEDLTGDYSQANFSAARMARIKHYQNVHKWRWNMLIPQLCDEVWSWAMSAALDSGLLRVDPGQADWTAPPMPMIEPDREGLAYMRNIRAGIMTLSEAVREQGRDLIPFLNEYQRDQQELDKRGIKLDSDVRATSQAGLSQMVNAAKGSAAADDSGTRALAAVEKLAVRVEQKPLVDDTGAALLSAALAKLMGPQS